MEFIKGSFRDPDGVVVKHEADIVRFMSEQAKKEFESVIKTGFLQTLVESQRLVRWETANFNDFKSMLGESPFSFCVRHPTLSLWSLPYEWSFNALKKAALFHLELQIQALEKSVVLSDATAYNIQFMGTQPIFIDHLSFKPYQEGMPWLAHNQFCTQFLFPLLLTASTGLHFGLIYRSTMQGIQAEQLLSFLPWYKKLSPHFLMHVSLPCWLKKRESSPSLGKKLDSSPVLSKKNYRNLLDSLSLVIDGLKMPEQKSLWSQYNESYCIYEQNDVKTKESFLSDFIKQYSIQSVLDLGCNTGKYAALAIQNGANSVVGLDSDPLSINQAFSYAEKNNLNLLPLVMDLSNPSPAQGWRSQERESFFDRFKDKCQAVFALALIHHLRFSGGIPLDQIIEFITRLGHYGVIEFIPKTDPMVGKLLRCREDIFNDYTQEHFESILDKKAHILSKQQSSHTGRHLYSYHRKENIHNESEFKS